MTQLLRIVFQLSWWLGLLSIVAAAVIKLLQAESHARVRGGTLFLVASAFFLCALATREMQRARAGQ